LRTGLLFLAVAIALVAQIGQRPPGFPRPGSGSKKTTEDKPAAVQPRTYTGVIRTLDPKSFDLEEKDTRVLTIRITDKTVKPAGLKIGDGVDVEAIQDKEGQFEAVSVKLNPEAKPKVDASDPVEPETQTAGPSTIVAPKGPLYDEGDSGPPKLKHGSPAAYAPGKKRTEGTPETPAPDAAVTVPDNPRRALVEKAREVAATFDEGLPNYICNEVITRYHSEAKVTSWAVQDVLSAEVVYEDRKESYRNITINGKASKKSPEESGAWSTGEFGSILVDLVQSTTAADFKYAQDATIAHLSASIYDYAVARPRSHWKVKIGGQYIFPAYKGSVWIEKQGAHVLRIEMQAKEIPAEFPDNKVESAVDYEYVSLGTPEKFLLPVRAEVLACGRGSYECERNVIEFRNYHKFSGASTIKFNQ